jgi:hypothetical protein
MTPCCRMGGAVCWWVVDCSCGDSSRVTVAGGFRHMAIHLRRAASRILRKAGSGTCLACWLVPLSKRMVSIKPFNSQAIHISTQDGLSPTHWLCLNCFFVLCRASCA